LSHIYQIDLTGNVQLTGTVSGKLPVEALYQIVAQNIRVNDGSNLEEYIKRATADKDKKLEKEKQLDAYTNLPTYADDLVKNQILSQENRNQIEFLFEKFKSALAEANKPENRGFFPSFFKLIEFIDATDPDAHIVINSFGRDIPSAITAIRKRFPTFMISDAIAEINKDGKIEHDDRIYEITDLPHLAKKFKVLGLRSNYALWDKGKGLGKPLIFESNENELETDASFLMDDNADICLNVYRDGEPLSQDEGFNFARKHGLVLHTDTAGALTNEDYFVEFLKASRTFQRLLKSK
jgi:hypothetical protein